MVYLSEPGDKKGPSYKSVVSWYSDSINDLMDDNYNYKQTGIKNNIFTVDFSELFLYMFYSPTSRIDTSLLKYIFNLDTESKDFKFILFPPTIIELRRHYEFLGKISKKHDYLKKASQSEEFNKLINKFDYIQKNNLEINSPEYTELLSYWKLLLSKYKDFDIISLLATDYGANNVIAKSHNRLVDLFRNNVILDPEKIDFLKGRTQEIESNEKVFNEIYTSLNNDRNYTASELNNFVDAEQAALSYDANQRLSELEILNIFTGSPVPLRTYKSKLNIELRNHKFNLARCPTYMTIRSICSANLRSMNKEHFLKTSREILEVLKDEDSFKEYIIAEAKHVEEMDESQRASYGFKKAFDNMIFYEIYFKKGLIYNLGKTLNFDHFKGKGYNIIKNYFYDESNKSNLINMNDFDQIERIALTVENFKEQGSFENGIIEAQKSIYNNAKEIYGLYMNSLLKFNPDKLSNRMQKHYVLLQEPPKEIDV